MRCGLNLYGQDLSAPMTLNGDGRYSRPIYPLLEWQSAPCQRCGFWDKQQILQGGDLGCPRCDYPVAGQVVRASWLVPPIRFEHETSSKEPDDPWEVGDRCVAPPGGWRGVYLVESDPFDPLHVTAVHRDGCVDLVSLHFEIQWAGVPPKVPIRYY